MNISELLAPGPKSQVKPRPAAPQTGDSTTAAKPRRKAPTKARKPSVKTQRKPKSTFGPKRKHKTYLSATQIAKRDAHAAVESKELHLTLDVNDLHQLIRMLGERRDLHVTRLLLARDRFKNDIYLVMERYMRVFGALSRRRTCDELTAFLSRVDPCMLGPGTNAKGSFPHFVWQWGCYNNRFHHWDFRETSTRIVTFIEEDSVQEDRVIVHASNSSSQVCGLGGCVVETVGEFAGKPTRAMVAAMFPNLVSDEGYTASLTLQTMHFPTRMFVYFDAHGKIVKHVLEADAFAALQAIVQANSCNNMSVGPHERFIELPDRLTVAAIERGDTEVPIRRSLPPGDNSSSEVSSGSRHDVTFLLN
ncbi:hypothetical protein PHYPSEUDO_005332 [Phytophthora pseudosyringae]|uniref:Uncharacterized protein n=1 Tax=Phytophthora pseudosyringae TaxID=221518 RepID=A0A8T1VMA9_9STRA|nr:hypothetical protein PHYPSEUDO_005332 [Phytophthora pseudosyringae]